MPERRLSGKVALVTGGAGGIGAALCAGFAREGAAVAVADVDSEAVTSVTHAIEASGGEALGLELDVRGRPDVERVVDVVAGRYGAPDVLVTCAGVAQTTSSSGALELSDDEWDAVINVNLRGTFLCAQAVARRLVAQHRPGSIVTVSSIGSARPPEGVPAYHAAKAGIVGLTRAFAVALAPHRIRVNALAPGAILTGLTRETLDDPDAHAVLRARIPLHRMGVPEELVGAAVFLASDEASYVTGQTLFVDGGMLVHGWIPSRPPEDAAAG